MGLIFIDSPEKRDKFPLRDFSSAKSLPSPRKGAFNPNYIRQKVGPKTDQRIIKERFSRPSKYTLSHKIAENTTLDLEHLFNKRESA